MVRKSEIPATPGSTTPDVYSFLDSVRQNIVRINEAMIAQASDLAAAIKFTKVPVYDNLQFSAGVFTVNPAFGGFQKVMNSGAHSLRPPAANCQVVLHYTNGTGAGVITPVGFTKVTGTAAPPANSVVAAATFMARISVINGQSWLEWQAL